MIFGVDFGCISKRVIDYWDVVGVAYLWSGADQWLEKNTRNNIRAWFWSLITGGILCVIGFGGVDLRPNLIQFGHLIAFLFDPLIFHQPQLRRGIFSIIMGRLSVQNLGQFWTQFNTQG